MTEIKHNSQPAIRPDGAKHRRTYKPEAIRWQCVNGSKYMRLAAGDSEKRKEVAKNEL